MNSMTQTTMAGVAVEKEEDSSDDSDEEDTGRGAKFGEPLTRIQAQDGFASRSGVNEEAGEDEAPSGVRFLIQ